MRAASARWCWRRLKSGRPDSSNATTSPSTTVLSGRSARASKSREYWLLKEFRRLENRLSLPPDFTAMARYPSNLTSNNQSGPVGSVGTARHSHGLSEGSGTQRQGFQCSFELAGCHAENKDGWRCDGRGAASGGKPLACQMLLNCSIVAGA